MAKETSLVIKACERITKYSIYALVFLVPLFFLPWTSDVLDFNKQALLVFLVFLAVFCWMIQTLVSGKLKVNANKTNIAIVFLLLVYLVSTIFSVDRYGSFWGWPQPASESLVTIICLSALYFLISSVFSKKEVFNLVFILALSAVLAEFVGFLQLLGLYLPFDFAKSASFNTIGGTSGLGLFAAIFMPIMFVFLIISKSWKKILFIAGMILIALIIILIDYQVIWWISIASSALVVVLGIFKKNLFDARWLVLPMFFLAISLFFIILNPQIRMLPQPGTEIYLSQKASFDIGAQSLKEKPLFGSGPATFGYNFLKYKKADFNNSILWSVVFSSAGTKFLTNFATLGVFGILAILFLMALPLFYGAKFLFFEKPDGPPSILTPNTKNEKIYHNWLLAFGLFVALLSQNIAHFLYGFNLVPAFLYFFLIAAMVNLIVKENKEYELKSSSAPALFIIFIFTMVFIFGLGIVILEGQRYIAELNYSSGLEKIRANQADEGVKKIETAASMNSGYDLYFRQLSGIYLSKISAELNREDISEEDRTKSIQALIQNSINASKIATDINPNNTANWSSRGYIYQSLIGLIPDAPDWAIKSYDEAIELDPANPDLPTQEGIVYLAQALALSQDEAQDKMGILEKAEERLNKAISLKTDYASARFQLAMVYRAEGKTEQAVALLEEMKKNSPNDVGLAFQMGLLYYQMQNYQKAKLELERAMGLSPNYANALYFLGLTYSKLGQKDKAIEAFSKLAESNPDNENIRKISENLKNGEDPLAGISQTTPAQTPVEEKPGQPE